MTVRIEPMRLEDNPTREAMNPGIAYRDDLLLVALPTAIRLVDLYARSLMLRWGMAGTGAELARVTGELVTNAVRCTGILDDSVAWQQAETLNFLTVRVLSDRRTVYVEVHDVYDKPPTNNGQALAGKEAGFYFGQGGVRVVWCKVPVIFNAAGCRVMLRVPALPMRQRFQPQSGPMLSRDLSGLQNLSTAPACNQVLSGTVRETGRSVNDLQACREPNTKANGQDHESRARTEAQPELTELQQDAICICGFSPSRRPACIIL